MKTPIKVVLRAWLQVIYFFCLCRHALSLRTSASYAISSFISEYFAKESPQIKVVCYRDCVDRKENVLSEILSNSDGSVAFQLFDATGGLRVEQLINLYVFATATSSIYLFESMEVFVDAFCGNTLLVQDTEHRHLVYVQGASSDDIAKNTENGFEVDVFSFLVNESELSIDLASVFMYTPQACQMLQIKTINRFDKRTMKWENQNFFLEKYENLHNCSLYVGESNVKMKERGSEIKIIETLAETQNFKIKSATRNNKVDLMAKSTIHANDYTSDVIYFENYLYFIGPGEAYDDFEKIFLHQLLIDEYPELCLRSKHQNACAESHLDFLNWCSIQSARSKFC